MVLKTLSSMQTERLGSEIGKKLKRGIVCLYGDLGAGKTTFVRGLARGLGISGRIQSPTFTYQREHLGPVKLHHFDCYRVIKADALLVHEICEALEEKNSVTIIEWAERISDFLPKERMDVFFEHVDEKTRKITTKKL